MNIVLTGGGTGGHVIPLLALVNELKNRFDNIYFVGSETGVEKDLALSYGLPFFSVPSVKFVRKKLFANLKIPFALSRSVSLAKKLLKKLKPDVVFGKGGFASLPVCIAAKKLRIPLAVHESDASFGLANKLLLKKADLVMTNFDMQRKNCVTVGMPLREDLFSYSQSPHSRPIVLFVGGSSGAQSLNACIVEALGVLTEKYDVVHITGRGKATTLDVPHYTQIEYTDKIGRYLTDADVVISRAGATAASELVALNKRIIFVPLENSASRGDQLLNAEYYKTRGYADVLREKHLSPKILIRRIEKALTKPIPDNCFDKNVNSRICDLLSSLSKRSSCK